MHERAALRAGEDGGVDLFGKFLFAHDHAAARAAQGLVRGGGHDVGIGHGAHVRTAGDETRDVRHVDHEKCAVLVGDVRETLKVDGAGIGRRARDDELRLVELRQTRDLVIVDAARVRVDAVGHGVVDLAGLVGGCAVGQVTAAGEVHAEQGVARLQQRRIHRKVCLRTAVRLDVDEFRAEELLGAGDGETLDLVDDLAAAVIALGGQALGVFVGQHRAHAGDDGARGDILRGDQLDAAALPAQLAAQERTQLLVKARYIFNIGGKFGNGTHGSSSYEITSSE